MPELRQRTNTLGVLGLLAIVAGLLSFAPASLARTGTAAPAMAGVNGEDYASEMIGNSWDMDSPNDIAFEYTREKGGLSGLTIANGLLEATATTGDPRVTLLLPSNPLTNPVLPEGGYRPIDAGKYKFLTVRLNVSANTYAQVFWQAAEGSPYGATDIKAATAGWNTLVFDLTAGGQFSTGSWSGAIQGLYFDPMLAKGNFKIDYVRLSTSAPINPDNNVPQLKITAPSYISGPDYAGTELGNPWDMSDSSDIAATAFLNSTSFSNGIFSANTDLQTANCDGVVCGDSQITLRVGRNIDTNRYKYLTYRMKVDGKQDTDLGSVARILWWTTIPEEASVSNSWVVYEGWRTVSFDLRKLKLEGNANTAWTSSNPRTFRFDPHEFAAPHPFQIDYVLLTGDNEADSSFEIRYQASDADGPAPTTQFFYDTNTSGFDGTAISCSTAPTPSGNFKLFIPSVGRPGADQGLVQGDSCRWNTAGLPAGTYYIYGIASDGTDATRVYSETPVVVKH